MSFTKLDPSDLVISTDSVTAPAWSSNVPVISSFYTSTPAQSTSITQNAFYLNVYQAPVGSTSASVQFAIAYGNQQGSGSLPYNPLVVGVTPSLTTYNQYNTLIYGPAVSSSAQGFNFGGAGTNVASVFAINVDRNRYKESLFPGSFNLLLSGSGTNRISLTDDSGTTTLTRFLGENRYYNIISGSNGSPFSASAATRYYGILLPDIDLIILDPDLLTGSITPPSSGSTARTDAAINLYNSLVRGGSFQLQSAETISARYFFTRVKNSEFNYTTNPSIIDDNGNLLYNTLINNPQTYITTVGMYNDNNELLAVAKLSKPLTKDFTKEALIRIKLDY
jgi:hypothetical protein